MSDARSGDPWPLEILFGGLSRDAFFRDIWGRRALRKPAADPSAFAWLMTERDLWSMGPGAAQIDVRYLHDRGERRGHTTTTPEQMRPFFDLGATLCVQHIEGAVPQLAAALVRFRTLLGEGHRAWFNCYASPDTAGFREHYDAQHVWILQIEGHKRWRHGEEPLVPGALRDLDLAMSEQVTRQSLLDPSSMTEVVLSPGDLLYLPPGTPHRAEAIGRSIALTLSVAPMRALDYALAAVLDEILEAITERDDRSWLAEAPALGGPEAIATWARGLAGRLPTLFSSITGPKLAALRHTSRRWGTEAAGVIRPTELPGFVTLVDVRPLGLVCESLEVVREGDRIRIRAEPRGEELALPAEAEPLVRELARARMFTLRQAQGWRGALDSEDVRDLCKTLYSVGLLQHLV